MTVAAIAAIAAAVVVTACVDPASDRADRDFDAAGTVERDGVRVTIEPGIAIADGAGVRLRASAPDFTIRVDGDGEVAVTIDNVAPEATLDAAARVTGPTSRALIATAPATITARTPPASRPVRFAFFSDVHASVESATAIAAAIAADPAVDFAVSGGDLVDTGGDPAEWDRVMPVLATLEVPVYGTIGNHELNAGDGELHHARFGRMNVAITFHGVRLILFDSGSGTLAPRVRAWLADTLAAPDPGATIAITHVPPRDPDAIRNGGWSSTAEADAVLAELARAGVAATLYGHIHDYVEFTNAGIPAWISGGGAVSNARLDDVGRHVLIVDVEPAAGTVAVTRHDLGLP